MDAIINFFGNFLSKLNGNLGYALLILACLVKVLTFFATYHDIKTFQIYDVLKPQYNNIFAKYAKDPQKRTSELLMLQKSYGCKLFAGMENIVTNSIILACIAYTFMNSQYLSLFNFSSFRFLWINDLTLSPLNLITREETTSFLELIGSLILPAASAFIYYILAKYIAEKSFMDKKIQQFITFAVIIAVGLFAPQAASLYLFAILSLIGAQYLITVKYFPVKIESKNKKQPKKTPKP